MNSITIHISSFFYVKSFQFILYPVARRQVFMFDKKQNMYY